MLKPVLLFVVSCLTAVVSLTAHTGTWWGNLEIQGVKLPIVFNLSEDPPTMDSPDQSVKGIPIVVDNSLGALVIKVPKVNAEYNGFMMGDKIIGTFTQHGYSFPLTLQAGRPSRRRPQTPQPPFPYLQEEVSFVNGDAVLKGTLVLPEGYNRRTPVVLMVTGSGLQNRDEEMFEHKPFAVIADALARDGIASLRYDDRGFGESTGGVINATTDDFKADALAGLKFLRTKFDKVGILGHSEGGTIGLMLGAEGEPDFIVSIAGMVVSGAETLLEQNRRVLAQAKYSPEVIDAYCDLLKKAFTNSQKGKPMPSAENSDLPEELKKNYLAVVRELDKPYMRRFVSLDMRPLLEDIDCPVLAFNGTKDIQVNYETNLEALRKGLIPNSKHSINEVDGANHLMQSCTTGDVSEYAEIEQTFDPTVLQTIVLWIKSFK